MTEFGGSADKPLLDLERKLTPPDEYDPPEIDHHRQLLKFVMFG